VVSSRLDGVSSRLDGVNSRLDGVNARLTVQAAPDAQALAVLAADLIAEQVQLKPDLKVLVASGSTPTLTYAELARRVRAGSLDFSRVTAVQLDEYLNLEPGDPRRLWSWTEREVLEPLGIRHTLRFAAGGDLQGAGAGQVCADYDAGIEALGGIDLAILGLGPNGHLGFNEPPSPADAPTRVVELSAESRVSNRAYWGRDVPERALTAGMSVILAARRTLLLVAGAHKQSVLRRVLDGPATPELPASLLNGPGVTVLADQAALGTEVPAQQDSS
jgi:glucosamine-6-phosphate deaminase